MSALPHPVRVVVTDDLRRSRLTVFFRLILAIPHYIWALLLGTVVGILVVVNWFILLFKAQTPDGVHRFIAGYVRYLFHLEAYFVLAANPYPAFFAIDDRPYPVDLEIDPPARQNRWKTGFRAVLAIPALMLASALFLGGPRYGSYATGGLALGVAFFAWWVAMFRARLPRGMRDLLVYCLGYSAQASAYLLLLTDRYPHASPSAFVSRPKALPPPAAPLPEGAEFVETAPSEAGEQPPHPVSMSVTDDLHRSRVLVFFRIPLLVPHLVWYLLWAVVAFLTSVLTWVCAIAIGRPPRPFHRFLSRFVRYSTHLGAFATMVGNPFPGFVGKPGSYPIDLDLPPPTAQSRWVSGFRLLLAIPAFAISGALSGAGLLAGILGWFVGLILGRMPDGLRDLGAYSLRYSGQVNAYFYFITARYPDSGPRPDPASP